MDPFVFVIGCERSGTTLLRAMLDSHPELAIPPESHFLKLMMREDYDRERFLSLLSGHRRFARWELSIQDVSRALDESPARDCAEAIRVLYSTYARSRGKRRWGDKTPEYVRHVRGLSAFLPEAHFVHVIRDGRDVTLSWLDVPFGPTNVADAAERWRKDVSAGRWAGQKIPDRYLEIGYETLVDRPLETLRTICDFIGLEFDDEMLRYTQNVEHIIAGTLEPGQHQRLHQEPTPGLRDWRTQMSPRDVGLFEEIAGDVLLRHGYPTTA